MCRMKLCACKFCIIKYKYLIYIICFIINYLASACINIPIFSALGDDPRTQTTSPYCCIIDIISLVASGVQSVNNETKSGTLSMHSK